MDGKATPMTYIHRMRSILQSWRGRRQIASRHTGTGAGPDGHYHVKWVLVFEQCIRTERDLPWAYRWISSRRLCSIISIDFLWPYRRTHDPEPIICNSTSGIWMGSRATGNHYFSAIPAALTRFSARFRLFWSPPKLLTQRCGWRVLLQLCNVVGIWHAPRVCFAGQRFGRWNLGWTVGETTGLERGFHGKPSNFEAGVIVTCGVAFDDPE